MLLNLTELSNQPIHLQIARQVLERIVRGDLVPGEVLPSAGTLAKSHRLSTGTVGRAFRELEGLGVIDSASQEGGTVYKIAPPMPAERIADLFRSWVPVSSTGIDRLERFEDGRYRRLEGELKKAGQIQRALLPRRLPFHSELQLAGFCHPSLIVGGDFFDVLPLGSNRLALVVADACGKGIPAALLVAQIQAILKIEALRGSSIGEMMELLNRYLHEFSSSENFVTLFYAQFDLAGGRLRYVNAGHNPAVVCRAEGGAELLGATGFPLGMFARAGHTVESIVMDEGDSLMVYSDGLTEARNPQGEEFGLKRLRQALADNRAKPAGEVVESIGARLESFHQAGWWQDDRTLLVMKRPRLDGCVEARDNLSRRQAPALPTKSLSQGDLLKSA
ncbi:MAG TPA: SpoIIE family protein phosphatase [Acidobacteriota bacterium]|nr:SpoIIE family protein phosphatase [Acidobacteriota bacterium]